MVSEPSILATESMEDEIRFQILEEHIKNQDAKLTEFEDTVQKQFSEFQKQMSDLMSDLNASMNTKLEAWLNAITPGNKRTAWDNLKQSDVTLLEKSPAAEVEVEPMVSPMILDEFIEEKGYKLNSEGGILKVSPDGLLLQSSTVANSNSFEFADGVKESVPCSYNEFAERLVLPQYKNHPEKGNAYMRNEKFDIHNCADNKFGYDEHGNLQGDLIVFEKTEINGILCHNWIDDRNFTGAVFNDDEDFVEVLDDFPKLKLEQNIEKLEVIGIRMKSNKKLGNSWVENATGFKGGTIFARKYWVLYQCNGTFCDSYNFSRVVTSSRFTAKLIGSWHFHISWNPWLLVESDVARMTFLIPILHKLLFKHKVELNLLWDTVFNTGLAPLSRNVYGVLSRSYNFRKFFSCGTHFTLYSKNREGVLGNESVYILVALIRLVQDETEMLWYGCVKNPELKLVGEKAKDAFVFEQSEATVELSLLVSADLQTKATGNEQPAAACDKRMNIQLIQDGGSVTLGGLVKTPTLQLIRGKAKEPFFMAVSKWRYYLRGHHFRVRTDHQYVKSLLLQGCVENPELKLGKGKAKSTAFQAEIPTEQDVTLGRRIVMAFQVLGFVFSDVRTSPLYTFSVMFSKDPVKGNEDVLGALSLVLYTLILIPLIKHVLIVLWANDHGESGTFALYSLICRHTKVSLLPNQLPSDARISSSRLKVPSAELERSLRLKKRLETSLTMKKAYPDVSSCWYFYGDSRWCVTSAMSVLFCLKVGVSGIKQDQVLMISIAFLVILFSVQRYETSKVGIVVGSALLIWFCSLGCIGIYNLVKYDTRALKAFNPVHIYYFFRRNSTLRGCLLCVTGSEAMLQILAIFL